MSILYAQAIPYTKTNQLKTLMTKIHAKSTNHIRKYEKMLLMLEIGPYMIKGVQKLSVHDISDRRQQIINIT